MEIKTIKNTSKQLEIEINGETETLLNPITQVLLRDTEVEYASTIVDHPQAPYRRLYIRLKSGSKKTPIEVLQHAVAQVKNDVKEFKKELETAQKSKK